MSEFIFDRTCAVVTMSDKGSLGLREDTSGKFLQDSLVAAGYELQEYQVIPDVREKIVETLTELVDQREISLIITTGGTGLSPSDVTPEAMEQVLDREIPGIAEAMRAASMKKTSRAMLSRGRAGTRKNSLIINLPGSLKAVRENYEVIVDVLDHALEKIQGGQGDCGHP